MEVGVRCIGFLLRVLNFLLAPLFWFRTRNSKRVTIPPKPIHLRSTKDLANAVREGELTSEFLVTAFIERVKEVNPLINAVVEDRYDAAVEDARDTDRLIAEARRKGTDAELFNQKPLLGVPFTVKESCSLGGLSNAVGCIENASSKAKSDGAAVRLLREAGGIPMLVSNTPELCLGWETTNLLTGTTNNPYDLSRTPGGSSGGEAALISCGASPFGLASDIAGSVRVPAAFCGLYGHKPTPGIIDIAGHVPSLDDPKYSQYLTMGPITRKAEDLPFIIDILNPHHKEKLKLDEPVDLKKVKVLYMTEATKSPALIDVEPCIKEAIVSAAKYLEKCGCTLSEEKFTDLEDSVEISISEFFEMKDIPNMLHNSANPKRDKSLPVEIVKSAFGVGTRSLQGLGFSVIHKTNLFIPESRRGYYSNKANKLKEKITSVLGANGVLLYPVFSGAAHAHGGVFVRAGGVLYSMVANILALPATAVPLSHANNLPLAVQIIAAPYQDRLCLEVARQLEVGFGGWAPPH